MISHVPVFEEYEAKRDYLRTWVRRHYIEEFGLKPGTLLDLGCGNGFWSGLFAEAGFTVTGLDVDPDYIFEGRLKHSDVEFVLADARLPLDVPLFDTVFIRAISSFYRPTLDDAQAVIHNALIHSSGVVLLSAYTDGSDEDRHGLSGETLHHYPIEAFPELVEKAGGTVLRTTRVGNYLQVLAR
jgi:SAM-dependent methyltransferase